MTVTLTPLQLFDYYLSLGIDETIAPKPVVKRKKELIPLLTSAAKTPDTLPKKSAKSLEDVDLSALKTLEDLRKSLDAFDMCSLKQTALKTVFCDGNPSASVMLIGEAPGADEDEQGKPFVGISGQLLDRVMATIGLDRSNFYITNIIPWRPPGNRQPSPEETRLCLPFVRKHIELVDPKILIFVGGTSAKALMNTTEGITRLRGRWLSYGLDDGRTIPAFALYHPAYLLRSPGQKKVVWHDMIQLKCRLLEMGLLGDKP